MLNWEEIFVYYITIKSKRRSFSQRDTLKFVLTKINFVYYVVCEPSLRMLQNRNNLSISATPDDFLQFKLVNSGNISWYLLIPQKQCLVIFLSLLCQEHFDSEDTNDSFHINFSVIPIWSSSTKRNCHAGAWGTRTTCVFLRNLFNWSFTSLDILEGAAFVATNEWIRTRNQGKAALSTWTSIR